MKRIAIVLASVLLFAMTLVVGIYHLPAVSAQLPVPPLAASPSGLTEPQPVEAAPVKAAPVEAATVILTDVVYSWTKHWGHTAGEVSATRVAVDASGNLYVSGQFSGTVNFDPAGVNASATFTSSNHTFDAYLLKLGANGQYQWAKTWGSSAGPCGGPASRGCGRDAANSVVVDVSGNAYVAGLFQNTVNFGNGHTATSNAPNGTNNIFFTKFDASGANQWVRAWGGTTGGEAYSLALDATRGYVYVQGDWSTFPSTGTVDFNPGGTGGLRDNHGFYDAFLVKYDLNGNFQWVRTWGGLRYDDGTGVAVDEATGNVYVCGMYGSQDINFDPAGTPAGLGHPSSDDDLMLVDVFLTAFDANGNWRWVRTWGGPGYQDAGSTPAVDHAGNVYAIARFGCQGCNFNVGAAGPITPGTVYTASGTFDIALSKFDADGNYLWSQAWGGPLIDQPISLVVDKVNNVYVASMVTRTVGGSIFNPVVTSTASLAKIASDGTLQWTKTWGGTGDDMPAGMALDGAGNLYVPGQFQHTIDFNPDSGVDNMSARGVLDAFLSKFLAPLSAPALLAPPDGTVTTTQAITLAWQAGSGNAPTGYNVDLDGQVITTSGTTSDTLLANGVHTWTARAYNAAGYSAWVTPTWTFEITDTLPAPRSPILMSPSNGSLTMTQAITFSWRADTGAAPTGYNVQIDGNVITATGTSSATVLSMGVHTWTVRAYNGVGYSGWAAPWTVEVRRYDLYLPLVMRNP